MKVKVKNNLETKIIGKNIFYYEEAESTQGIAKELASQGSEEGTVVIAKTQKVGKGRRGRKWSSPDGGIYMSVIFRPEIDTSQISLMSLLGGVAVAETIQKHYELKPELKWPNDIEIKGKKIGGILIENSTKNKHINWMVMGLGLNVNTERSSFSTHIREIATSLREEIGAPISIPKLGRNILKELDQLYLKLQKYGHAPILSKWKELTNTLGSQVKITNGDLIEGKAIDVNKEGALLVKSKKGEVKRVTAGDVSLRKASKKN